MRATQGFDVQYEWLDLVQWPAMVVTLLAAWLVASKRRYRRNWGFWTFLSSNVLWIVWGLYAGAYALIGLQIGLAVLNIRGTIKTHIEQSIEK